MREGPLATKCDSQSEIKNHAFRTRGFFLGKVFVSGNNLSLRLINRFREILLRLNSEELGRSCESVRVTILNRCTHFLERLGLGKTVITKRRDELDNCCMIRSIETCL